MTQPDPSFPVRLLSRVEGRRDEQLSFLMELSRRNSFSWNKAGTDSVGRMVADKLAGAFPRHRVVPLEKVGDLHLFSNVGPGEKSIYVVAHMDTVFPPEHPFKEVWIEGDKLHGPGTGDMKAGVVTSIYAALVLQDLGAMDRVPLTLVFSGDEEVGAVASRGVFQEEVPRALACLVVEGAGPEGEIVLSRFGKMGARLECRGQDTHVGAKELKKASAVLELAHKTVGIEGINGTIPDARLNVGRVEGGLGPATIPGAAEALLDIRWKDQAHRDALVERIREVVARNELPGCSSELVIMNERPAWPPTPGTEALGSLIREAGAQVGQEIGFEHRMGTSDSNFFGAAGVPTVDGMGPVCAGYHTPQELVYISSVPRRTALLAAGLVKVAEAWEGEGGEGPEGAPRRARGRPARGAAP